MKIVHICVSGPYNDNWGYQDNLLPKYQGKLGHDVTVITANRMHKDSQVVILNDGEYEKDYHLEDGQRIIRLKGNDFGLKKLPFSIRWFSYFHLLKEIRPDFIMIHGLNNFSSIQAIQYKKKINPQCQIVMDNHLDYNIGKVDGFLKKILYPIEAYYNKTLIYKHCEKIYGVTPWRVTYMCDVFKVPKEKADLLLMGADDEKIHLSNKETIRTEIRGNLGISSDDFLLITGGKIDENKNIAKLMEAIIALELPHVKLIVFGEAIATLKEKIELLSKNESIVSIGWVHSDEVYDYFLASDLLCFPGQHSVLWEQGCACGIPGFFKYYEGMDHVNVHGSSRFFHDTTVDGIKKELTHILENQEEYFIMKQAAERYGVAEFSYENIARKSLL